MADGVAGTGVVDEAGLSVVVSVVSVVLAMGADVDDGGGGCVVAAREDGERDDDESDGVAGG